MEWIDYLAILLAMSIVAFYLGASFGHFLKTKTDLERVIAKQDAIMAKLIEIKFR